MGVVDWEEAEGGRRRNGSVWRRDGVVERVEGGSLLRRQRRWPCEQFGGSSAGALGRRGQAGRRQVRGGSRRPCSASTSPGAFLPVECSAPASARPAVPCRPRSAGPCPAPSRRTPAGPPPLPRPRTRRPHPHPPRHHCPRPAQTPRPCLPSQNYPPPQPRTSAAPPVPARPPPSPKWRQWRCPSRPRLCA